MSGVDGLAIYVWYSCWILVAYLIGYIVGRDSQ